MRIATACAVTIALSLGLADQNWRGAVDVEIAPPASGDTRGTQHAQAVDNSKSTGNVGDSGSTAENVPTLPASILSGAMQTAHACLMAGAYTVVFPLGAIATHIGPPGLGFGLGCYLATQTGINWDTAHPQLGTALIGLTALQPFIGFVHQRLAISHREVLLVWNIHAWYGRFLMALAVVQGGLGLQLADNYVPYPPGALAAFLVVSLLMLSIYSVVAFKDKGRRKRRVERRMAAHKEMQLKKQKQSQPQGQTQQQAADPQKLYSPLQISIPTTPLYQPSPQTPATNNFSRPMTPRPRTPKTPGVVSSVASVYPRA
ncbi:integral membrane protein [Diaporthe eres]|nr:integral membrane protein [Diaporthe eres]